ncbi:general stress protein [Carnobacterium jeotgali]|uniref:general stress protein n=1 Tax=Carnobacterium jeotgali TaxID=545534 RepID=UPI00389061F6
MSKVVVGSFSNVQETSACVEQLLAEGHSSDSIKIVTTKQDFSAIKEQSGVEVSKVSTEQDDVKSTWDKLKDMFTDTDVDDNAQLEKFGVDSATAAHYADSLNAGEYIVLSDETIGLNPSNQKTQEPIESSNPIVGQAGEGVRVVKNASQPTDDNTLANDGDDRLNNAEVPLETNFTAKKDSADNTKVQPGLTETTVPETIEEDDLMIASIWNEENPRLQDNQENDLSNGAFSKGQDRRDETRDVVTPPIDSLNHQEYNPNDNPLQGTPPTGSVPNDEPSGPSSQNQEELDLPHFDGSTLSGQPRNDPKRDFPNK